MYSSKKVLSTYAAAHGVVDLTCVWALFGTLFQLENPPYRSVFIFLTVYNLFAFLLQPFIGLLADHFIPPKRCAMLGCVFIILSSLFMSSFPSLAVIPLGTGNALFHVGGGIISLTLGNDKAPACGIFVAPGAFGLATGTLCGSLGLSIFLPVFLLTGCLWMILKNDPQQKYCQTPTTSHPAYLIIAVLFLLFTVFTRSYLGFAVPMPWKTGAVPVLLSAAFAMLGKGLGGFAAKHLGYGVTTAGGIVLAAPLLLFKNETMLFALIGILFINLTMPVTLAALSDLFPSLPGFAFGLAAAILYPGYIISLLFSSHWVIALFLVLSALLSLLGLKAAYYPQQNNRSKTSVAQFDAHTD